MLKQIGMVLCLAGLAVSCQPEVPLGIRSVFALQIPADKLSQCATLNAKLKAGSTLKAEYTSNQVQTSNNPFYSQFSPSIVSESETVGIDVLEVSCSASGQTLKAIRAYSGPKSRAIDLAFSDLTP
jgi:hypothetical protein